MKIISQYTSNPNMQIIEISGELTGRCAIELQEYLFARLDEGKCYQIINLKHVKKIDGLGINILHKFVSRGMLIRLFNARTEIRSMIKLSGKEDSIKTYNETDCDKVVSLFEKELLEEKDTVKDGAKVRRYPRINTFFPTEFKYHLDHNGEVICKANVLNLSEGGIFASKVMVIGRKTGKIVSSPDIIGKELHDLKFKLNGSPEFIETKGVCVWGEKRNGKLYAGIRFKVMRKKNVEKIRDYVYKSS